MNTKRTRWRWTIGLLSGVLLGLTYGPLWSLVGLSWPALLHLVDAYWEVRRA